jgi:tripartite-type tricarboxylate transporter receptor subunit TctC
MIPRTVQAAATALMMAFAAFASAQTWPAKPVRIVTAFGPGSASDIVARMLADELQAAFRQPFIVENKPGASGILAAEAVAKAAADGYTLILGTNTAHSVNPHLFRKLPYEPVASFTPIARVCYFPFVLAVSANSPAKSVEQLVALGRGPNARLTYAYGNSTGQIAGAAFASLKKLDATAVPYKSTPQALTDLVGGQVAFMFVDLASSRSYLAAGRLRLLAITSAQPSPQVPDLPTIAAAAGLPGFDLSAWVGVLGPAGLPDGIASRLSEQVNRSLARKEIAERLIALGADVAPAQAAEFDRYLRAQLTAWGHKVKDAGIAPE